MSEKLACPPIDQLRELHFGRLDEGSVESLWEHLDTCPSCESQLAQLEHETDPLIAALRVAGRATGLPRIPGYEILEVLGEGGMGVVYRARHLALQRFVALKSLRSSHGSPTLLDRLRREAEAAARLTHPHIVQVHEFGQHEGQPFLTMEYVSGPSLHQVLRGQPRTPREASELVRVLAAAVHYAHERGVIHRDIKPGNILLEGGHTPKLSDFGIAKQTDTEAGPTREGDIVGTARYMSPEQAQGTLGAIGPATDVYSLGAVLYELLVGRVPLQGQSELETLKLVVSQDPVPPRRFSPRIPRDLETIVLRCLAKEPRRRYATAAALADDLQRFQESRPILARPTPFWERWAKAARRHPTTATLIAVSILAGLGFVIGALYYNDQLRASAIAARAAEAQAQQHAAAASRQRDLALEAVESLVFRVQEKLSDAPETRPLREDLLNVAIAGLEQISAGAQGSRRDESLATAYFKLGKLFDQVGRPQLAEQQWTESRRIFDELKAAGQLSDLGLDTQLMLLVAQGQRLLQQDRPHDAQPIFQQVVETAEAWRRRAPGEKNPRGALLTGLHNLGHARHWAHEFEASAAAFERMRQFCLELLEEDPDDAVARRALSGALGYLADIAHRKGDSAAAAALIEEELRLAEQVVAAHPEDMIAFRDLYVVRNNAAGFFLQTGNLTRADQLITAAHDFARRQVEADPEFVQARCDMAEVFGMRGAWAMAAGRDDEAKSAFQQALEQINTLAVAGKLDALPVYRINLVDRIRQQLQVLEQKAAAPSPVPTPASHGEDATPK